MIAEAVVLVRLWRNHGDKMNRISLDVSLNKIKRVSNSGLKDYSEAGMTKRTAWELMSPELYRQRIVGVDLDSIALAPSARRIGKNPLGEAMKLRVIHNVGYKVLLDHTRLAPPMA